MIALILALLLLNASLTFANVWPTLGVWPGRDLSIELAVLVLALTLGWRWPGVRSRTTRICLAVLWVALIVGRYVDVTVRSLYGRGINLYWDLQFAPDVSAMFAFVANPWLAAAVLLGLMLMPVLISAPVYWAVARVTDAVGNLRRRRALTAIAAAVLVLAVIQRVDERLVPIIRFAEPVVPTYAVALREYVSEKAGVGERALAPPIPIRSTLSRVSGADVLLIFLESYGAVSWERPELAHALAGSRRRLEADIRETGRAVVSASVESTTFGGESWLAHLSLLSGTEVRDQRTNVRLMSQSRDTLVKAFGRQGYRTVAVMPGLLRGWPQGSFYGFDAIYDLSRLDYRGPPFGWWDINDQFALARADALEIAPRDRRPVFLFFPTITTHAPFTPAPPYQPDWSRVLRADAYDEAALQLAWSDQPDWSNLGPSYVQALAYAHATLGGYLRLRADRDLVVILLGDHQPPGLVSGAGASWNVPVHVIARRGEVLERLRKHRFREGLAPPDYTAARMDTLLPVLLDAFGDVE
jgi:hypothetical protein